MKVDKCMFMHTTLVSLTDLHFLTPRIIKEPLYISCLNRHTAVLSSATGYLCKNIGNLNSETSPK